MSEEKIGLKILNATYGVDTNRIDITKEIQQQVQDGELNLTVDSNTFGIVDPAPGVKKSLNIQYSVNGGKPINLLKDDGEVVTLSVPTPKDKKPNHGQFLAVTIGYFILAFGTAFLANSIYKLSLEGFFGMNYQFVGYILSGIIIASSLGLAFSDNVGIVGAITSLFGHYIWILSIIFGFSFFYFVYNFKTLVQTPLILPEVTK
jgi:hypothetical protein